MEMVKDTLKNKVLVGIFIFTFLFIGFLNIFAILKSEIIGTYPGKELWITVADIISVPTRFTINLLPLQEPFGSILILLLDPLIWSAILTYLIHLGVLLYCKLKSKH